MILTEAPRTEFRIKASSRAQSIKESLEAPDTPIVLLTDFGLDDVYVGVIKGVILQINPRARLIDLCHRVAPQNIAIAARMLAESYRYFPPEAIFVAVVDPGVGSTRRAIALRTPHGQFVGPDNGIFSDIAADFGLGIPPAGGPAPLAPTPIIGVALENGRYFLPRVSATFHGRDIFAPVAAHLSQGTPLAALGPAITEMITLPPVRPAVRLGEIRGHVVHVDRFGNAITDIKAQDLATIASPIIEAAGTQIAGISRHYAERPGLLALVGSSDVLEIALSGGDAATALGLRPGDPVIVRQRPASAGVQLL